MILLWVMGSMVRYGWGCLLWFYDMLTVLCSRGEDLSYASRHLRLSLMFRKVNS